MNLLTFLGTANYSETTYVLGDQRYTSRYCAAALAHFFRPQTTLIVVTEDAHAKHFESLADEIHTVTDPVEVRIPDGKNESQLWQIFEALTTRVAEESSLVADITNGFRSLPFLSFLAVAYLRTARRVTVQSVLYGAYEARNEDNESPVFDLTPFVTLLDWIVATDRFTRFGDARDLAALLRAGMPPGVQMGRDSDTRRLGKGLQWSADAMEGISLALRLARPLESMAAAENLVQTMSKQRAVIEPEARPFAILSDEVVEAYRPFGLPDPLTPDNRTHNLYIQLDMVRWYLDKEQIVQAVTLAREWLVSLFVHHLAHGSLVDIGLRKEVEAALNNAAERRRETPRPPLDTPFDEPLRALPQSDEVGALWDALSNLRNDLAHVGMGHETCPARSILERAGALYPRLCRLAGELLRSVGGEPPTTTGPTGARPQC